MWYSLNTSPISIMNLKVWFFYRLSNLIPLLMQFDISLLHYRIPSLPNRILSAYRCINTQTHSHRVNCPFERGCYTFAVVGINIHRSLAGAMDDVTTVNPQSHPHDAHTQTYYSMRMDERKLHKSIDPFNELPCENRESRSKPQYAFHLCVRRFVVPQYGLVLRYIETRTTLVWIHSLDLLNTHKPPTHPFQAVLS